MDSKCPLQARGCRTVGGEWIKVLLGAVKLEVSPPRQHEAWEEQGSAERLQNRTQSTAQRLGASRKGRGTERAPRAPHRVGRPGATKGAAAPCTLSRPQKRHRQRGEGERPPRPDRLPGCVPAGRAGLCAASSARAAGRRWAAALQGGGRHRAAVQGRFWFRFSHLIAFCNFSALHLFTRTEFRESTSPRTHRAVRCQWQVGMHAHPSFTSLRDCLFHASGGKRSLTNSCVLL